MHWSEILKVVGGTTVLVAAVGWLLRTIVSHLLDVRLAEWKADQETKLQKLRDHSNEHLEYYKAALARVEHLETDLIQSRGEAYGEIWSLTGSISVFSTVKPISAAELSTKLSHWWFAEGWLLTEESRGRCFLLQEVLSFYILHSLSFRRPADEVLFGDASHTLDVLHRIRTEHLGIEPRGDDGSYALEELQDCVRAWKSPRVKSARDTTTPEQAWILIQFLMSAFRSHLVKELRPETTDSEPKRTRTANSHAAP